MGVFDRVSRSWRSNYAPSAAPATAVPATDFLLASAAFVYVPIFNFHALVEMAVVVSDSGGSVLSEWTTLVNPEVRLPAVVHQVDRELLQSAPRLEDVLGDFTSHVAGRMLVVGSQQELSCFETRLLARGFRVVECPALYLDQIMQGVGLLDRALPPLPTSLRDLKDQCALDDAHTVGNAAWGIFNAVGTRFGANPTVPGTWVSPRATATGLVKHRRNAFRAPNT